LVMWDSASFRIGECSSKFMDIRTAPILTSIIRYPLLRRITCPSIPNKVLTNLKVLLNVFVSDGYKLLNTIIWEAKWERFVHIGDNHLLVGMNLTLASWLWWRSLKPWMSKRRKHFRHVAVTSRSDRILVCSSSLFTMDGWAATLDIVKSAIET
jgi:hypothetical protein